MLLQDLPDDILFKEIRRDNLKAYDVLFYRYSPKLFRFSLKYLNDEAIAEELVMDVLFQLWHKRKEIDIQHQLSSYLFRCLRNAIINHFRKNVLPVSALDSLGRTHGIEHKSPDHLYSLRELEAIYREELGKLSPQRRRVFELSRDEHKSYAEIAVEMNLSLNTVENYMVSALKFFRERMKGHLIAPSVVIIFFLHPVF